MEIILPAIPIYIMLPVCGAGFLSVVIQLWRLRDVYAAFLLLAMSLRYSLGAFHSYTFAPLEFGLSIVALSSIFIVAATHHLAIRATSQRGWQGRAYLSVMPGTRPGMTVSIYGADPPPSRWLS